MHAQQQQEIERRVAQAQQDKAEYGEIESMVAGLSAEKQQMEDTVHELMLRLQAATKHTQALADERTFLQDAQMRAVVGAGRPRTAHRAGLPRKRGGSPGRASKGAAN